MKSYHKQLYELTQENNDLIGVKLTTEEALGLIKEYTDLKKQLEAK